MAQITFTFPDAVAPRVVTAICFNGNYQDELESGVPNPETKAQFARRMVMEWVKDQVRTYEGNTAFSEGMEQAIANQKAAYVAVDTEIEVT